MDFSLILADLQRAGLTQSEIADACKCSQSAISDLARGVIAEPRFSIGHCLSELHERHSALAAAAHGLSLDKHTRAAMAQFVNQGLSLQAAAAAVMSANGPASQPRRR